MTTTEQPAKIDYTSASYAQFPAPAQLPKAAAEPIETFLRLRERREDAGTAWAEAVAGVEKAKLADAAALLEHVRAGGKAADFKSAIPAALKDVEYTQADMTALDKLLGEQYVQTCLTLQRMHDEGAQLAAAAVEKAAVRYTAAITALETARQDYLAAVGVVLFWRYLVGKGISVVAGGHQITLLRGPITKVDQTTITLLRQDAETHLRARDAQL